MYNISEIFKSMIENPNIPKSYRLLKDYYTQIGMGEEASAVDLFLQEVFNELPEIENVDMPNNIS